MVPLASTTDSKQRSERRISVRLPLKVRGRDAHGFAFEEDTSSENLCRNGAAFVTRFDVAIGSDLEIRIPNSQYAARRTQPERFGGPANGNRLRPADSTSRTSPRTAAWCMFAIRNLEEKNLWASSLPARAFSACSALNPPPECFSNVEATLRRHNF